MCKIRSSIFSHSNILMMYVRFYVPRHQIVWLIAGTDCCRVIKCSQVLFKQQNIKIRAGIQKYILHFFKLLNIIIANEDV